MRLCQFLVTETEGVRNVGRATLRKCGDRQSRRMIETKYDLLEYHTAWIRNSPSTFRDNLSVPSYLTLEDRTDRWSRNVDKALPIYAALRSRKTADFICGSLKSRKNMYIAPFSSLRTTLEFKWRGGISPCVLNFGTCLKKPTAFFDILVTLNSVTGSYIYHNVQ